jgi:hypothetical protein
MRETILAPLDGNNTNNRNESNHACSRLFLESIWGSTFINFPDNPYPVLLAGYSQR